MGQSTVGVGYYVPFPGNVSETKHECTRCNETKETEVRHNTSRSSNSDDESSSGGGSSGGWISSRRLVRGMGAVGRGLLRFGAAVVLN